MLAKRGCRAKQRPHDHDSHSNPCFARISLLLLKRRAKSSGIHASYGLSSLTHPDTSVVSFQTECKTCLESPFESDEDDRDKSNGE